MPLLHGKSPKMDVVFGGDGSLRRQHLFFDLFLGVAGLTRLAPFCLASWYGAGSFSIFDVP